MLLNNNGIGIRVDKEQSFEEFRKIWMEMDKLDPLTPLPIWDEGNYISTSDRKLISEGAASDAWLFGEDNAYSWINDNDNEIHL